MPQADAAAATTGVVDDATIDKNLPEWLRQLEATPPVSREASYGFMAVWTGISGIALGGGAVLGARAFEETHAFEALDKLEKPTPAAEAQASRLAVRAFGWGTALAFGTASLAIGLAYASGIRSAGDVGVTAKQTLDPFDRWLHARGEEILSFTGAVSRRLDGACNGVAQSWRASWLGRFAKRRIEGGSNSSNSASTPSAPTSSGTGVGGE